MPSRSGSACRTSNTSVTSGCRKIRRTSSIVAGSRERVADHGRHVLDRPVPLHQLQGFFRADAFDALIEVGADQNRQVHQSCARDVPAGEQAFEHDRLGHDRPECPLARKKFPARYRQEADERRRAEEQRVVILARRRPHIRRGCGHVRRLRFAFGGRLHGRHAHQAQQFARFRDHLPRQPRGHRRLRVRLGQIAARQRRGVLLLVALPSGAPFCHLVCLAQGRSAVEDEHELERVLRDQARRSVEQARQVRRRASLGVLQRRAVAKPDEREKLVQLAIAVHRQRLAS